MALFGKNLSENRSAMHLIINKMSLKHVHKGDNVIDYGDDG